MTIEEIVQRLIYLSFRAVHYVGEQPFVMSLDDGIALKEAAEILKQQPERKKGKWMHDGHHIRCTECGVYVCETDREGDTIPRNYCPNCGADMREEGGA